MRCFIGISLRARGSTLFFWVTVVMAVLLQSRPVCGATFTVISTNDAGAGSLRQAILDANLNSGPDVIDFNIPGAGPHTIEPLTALPDLTDVVTVDGFTQPGASPNNSVAALNAVLLIELSGAQMTTTNAPGLVVASTGSRVRGLVINRFASVAGAGIKVTNTSGVIIDGNYIGTDVSGHTNLPNGVAGILIQDARSTFIGGASPAGRNLISGNGGPGLLIAGAGSSNNVVSGNFIGVDVTGSAALGNAGGGIALAEASASVISGNVISGNAASGIEIGQAAAVANRVQGNSIFGNGGLGIDLLPAGPTANDSGDADAGPNGLQNFPVLTSVVNGTNTTIYGTLSAATNAAYDLEFFANTAADPSGYGEGERWVGSILVNTDTNGEGSFVATLNELIPVGQRITATATDAAGNTSEFSVPQSVPGPPPVIICATNPVVECGTAWDFVAPEVTAVCGGTNFTLYASTVTNALCGATFSATRTWVAVDACGNSNTCSQTILVVDTVPPVITCSSNITVECTGGGGAVVSFTATATDSCDTNVLVYSVPASGSFFALGTNVVTSFAVDACNNTNTCTFTVTVLDTTPPNISCPANIIAAEFPRDSGFAPVTFAPPGVSDICEASLNVTVTPPSGSLFPVGTNTVTCVVSDSSGNSNSCTFTIRVIPYRLFVTTNVTTTADSGPGSLRQALLDANDSPGENLVVFNIPGPGPHIINLESALPEITSPVIINGWSQPGFAGLPLVTITGAGLTNAIDGLVLHAADNTVRGLVLNGFATAIKILGQGNNVIQGNFIGTDASGVAAAPNSGDGIYIASARNVIGGSTNWAPNVIAANGGSGIHIAGPGATNNFVRGNYIGIGSDFVTALGNGGDGVRLENGAARNSIGGAGLNSGNGIANNASNGVSLLPTAGIGNGIYGNSIFDNNLLGIDLNADGVTVNDAEDADAGPNNLLNHPVITDARSANGSLQIDGTYTGNGNAIFRLDFYLSNVADPSGSGEGRTHLGHQLFEVYGNGPETFTASFPVSAVYTQQVTATATDFADNTSEFSPAVTVRTPPVLESQPVSTNTLPGGTVVLCASASGTPPIFYQWRLNGVNIPDATNGCYEISSAEFTNGGSYSVVIYNELGAALTASAGVEVAVTNAVLAADDFADAVQLHGASGETAWSNANATRESGEPFHANKPGRHSVWYKWTAPEKGVLTIGSRGSDFDTLLGVYRGTNVAYLYGEGGDEDRGGYYTSGLRINVTKNRTYHFAVDGYGNDAGRFFFGWQQEFTPHLLPAILAQPQSLTVAPGSNATFTVLAARICGNGFTNCSTPLHYGSPEDPEPTELPNLDCQWLFNGVPIPGATNFSVTISNVQTTNLGLYRARLFTPWQTIESLDADLEINLTGDITQPVQTADKLLDVLLLPPWVIGDFLPPTTPPEGGFSRDTVVRGYTGTQIFSTSGSGTGSADEPICGVLGGASEYITFVPAESGALFLNTDGSSYDTVMAVFLRSPTNASLIYLVCDNNSGVDGRDSALNVPVVAGQTNIVLVDGVNGASGILQLNYSLLSSISLRALGTSVNGGNFMQVLSRTNANFSLQRSTNMIHWSPILTTNSPSGVYNHTDPTPPGIRYFYRAKLLP